MELVTREAINDITEGWGHWEIWTTFAWMDIRKRYRGSILGPFWITLSMGIWVTAIGLIYSNLFKTSIQEYLPYLTVGVLVWTLISTLVSESCAVFISSGGILRQTPIPASIFVFQTVLRNMIVFGHNVVIYVLILLVFPINLTISALSVIPAVLIYAVLGIGLCFCLGPISARYRDVPPITQSMLQVVFFLTPIFWDPKIFTGRTAFFEWNPIYHLIRITREPLLGDPVPFDSWLFVSGLVAVVGVLAVWLFARTKDRIVHWV
ncbi:MAG: ABC transporter permease [Pseudomonadota bacterium]